MNPTELLERVRQLWPAEVPTNNNERNDFYWELEDRIRGDDWLELGTWSFHQSLHVHVKAAISRGESHIPSSVVTVEEFDVRMRKNMEEESWDEIK